MKSLTDRWALGMMKTQLKLPLLRGQQVRKHVQNHWLLEDTQMRYSTDCHWEEHLKELCRSGDSLLGILFSAEITQKRFRNSQRQNAGIQYLVTTEKQVNRPTRGKQRKAKTVIVNQFFLCLRVTLFMLKMFYLSSDCWKLQWLTLRATNNEICLALSSLKSSFWGFHTILS